MMPSAHAVNPADAKSHHMTIFENMGDLITDTSYIHIMSTIDLKQYKEMFSSTISMFNQQTAKLLESQ